MKRVFTLAFMIVTLAVAAWGDNVFFANEVVEFHEGETPEMSGNMYHFHQNVLWRWDNGDVMSLEGYQDNDFHWYATVTGDMAIPEGQHQGLTDRGYHLNNSHVFFTGTQGTITVTAVNYNFNGNYYECTYVIRYHLQTSNAGKRWDFNTTPFNINGSWDGNETHMSTNPDSQVYHKYNSWLYFVDGSNAVAEAQGLIFYAPEGTFGGNNPSASEANEGRQGRFICFKSGASFTIPKSYFQDLTYPKIRIKMARFGNDMALTITNGKDALGNNIYGDGTYTIGGSEWIWSGGTWAYHGEYHFQPADKNQDFTIKVESGQYLMLFTIEVYDSYEMQTENSVLGTTYELLNNESSSTRAQGTYNLHFYGKGERTRIGQNTVSTTGTVTCESSSFVNTGDDLHYTYTSNVGEIGTFRMRMECYTHNRQYCTDYAWRTMAVGYMQEHAYPYTWDFTDVKTYIYGDGENRMDREDYYDISPYNVENGYTYEDYKPARRNLWQNYSIRVSPDNAHNFLFCRRSQLWCGKEVIPETQYLSFEPGNFDSRYNGSLEMDEEGLHFNQHANNWWCWLITVPSVPTNGVIYVRAHKTGIGTLIAGSKYLYDEADGYVDIHTSPDAFTHEIAVNDGSGDVVYVVPAPSQKTDVTLFFNGLIVRKISVATDPKKVNIKGYASESRNHAIDASLLPYFTGQDMKTYLVSNPNFDELTIELTDAGSSNAVEDGKHVIPANTGCVIRRVVDETLGTVNDKTFDVLASGEGFHLFVPDMHDETGKFADVTVNNTFMVPVPTEITVPYSGKVGETDMTNYVLSYKYWKLVGGTPTGPFEGEEKFYRVYSGKNIKLRANSAYLQLPTASVSPSGDATNAPNRAPSFRFKFDNNDYMRGDVNADQTVDVADFIGTANYILGNTPESFVFKAADLNKDYGVDVADFIGIANIILGKSTQSHAMNRAAGLDDTQNDALYVEPFDAIPGTRQVISVRMNNSVPVAGYEFNLRLPEGITVARDGNGYMAELSTERTNERRTNFFGTAMQADGTLKVLCGTSSADDSGLYTFYGDEGEVARITVNIPENYKQGMCTASVTDARYTDQEGQLYFFGTTTGINVIAAKAVSESDTYYTLSGQKLDGRPSQRGFYIVNGKKVLVK